MELYILSKKDLSILSICKVSDYQINLDEETNAKSTFTLIKTDGLAQGNFIVVNGLYRQFLFVIDDVQTEKSSNISTVTAIDISNIFDRKVIEKNIDIMKSKSIEEFLANTISADFVNSDDTALNVNYIEIYWHTNTQGNVATNAENGLYNFHTFLTNCRQYKNIYTDFKLENLGNPQTVEGKRISVEARNRKIVDISLHGESTQDGTPTPDYPSPIENVEGKNLFDGNKSEWGKYNVWQHNTGNYANAFVNVINIKGLNKCSISFKNNTRTFRFGYQFIDDNENYLSGVYWSAPTNEKVFANISVPENASKIIISQLDGQKEDDIEIQLEEGTVATPYVPYSSLEFKVEGKNRFDGEFEIAEYDSSGNKITTQVWAVNKNIINVKPNTTYTVSQKETPIQYRIICFSDDTFLQLIESTPDLNNGYKSYKFTTPENCNKIYIQFRSTLELIATGTYKMTTDSITEAQLEIGETATPYTPYQEQKVIFPLAEGQKLMEGSYLADDGIHHTRKQVVFDGTETWGKDPNTEGKTDYFYIKNIGITENNINNVFCTHFVKGAAYTQGFWATTVFCITINKEYTGIVSTDTRDERIAKFKNWLAEQYSNGTPVIIEYELAEPEIVPYTEEQQEAWNKIKNLTLFEGVNHISSDANMVLKYYPLKTVGLKFVLRIDIENKQETTELIDTTLSEVTDYNKIYEEDVTAKVQVYIREDGSEYNLYLKTDRTTTTNKDDPDRASGKIEVISVETADRAEEEALNVMKGNNYKHLVEFKIAKTSKLMDITKLHIGRPIRIKTDDDIYDSYISAITLSDENFVCFKSGSLRITLLDKLKQKFLQIT